MSATDRLRRVAFAVRLVYRVWRSPFTVAEFNEISDDVRECDDCGSDGVCDAHKAAIRDAAEFGSYAGAGGEQ